MNALVPESFSALVTGRAPEPHISGDEWLLQLPRLVEASLAEWDLTLDGNSMHGRCALVAPVRLGDSSTAVLKVTWPHAEAEHEHLALQHWGGLGAVRLLAANPGRWTMLLERLDSDRDLQDVPIDEACRVIGGLLRQLDHPALPQLSRLSAEAAHLVERLDSAPPAIPRRFVEQARSVLSDLVTDDAIDSRMVHTDLHYWNVLAADRQPWLAIDPKPQAADPAFAVAPALWNRWEEAVASGDLRRHLRRRLSIICEGAGLDEERARSWSIVREVQMGLWAVKDDNAGELTKAIAIIKAMQPN
ncbi:MAG: aminoglycoside phosphotransferase family protein [Dermatophilaceae bacterium]